MGSVAVTLGGSGMGAVLTVLNEAMAARILGPDGYGLYAIGMMLSKVGEILAVFGLPIAVLHYVPFHLDRSEPRLALGTIVGSMTLPLLLGVCFAASLWLGAGAIARDIFNAPAAAAFISIFGLAIPALALAELLGNTARALGRPIVYVLIRNVIPPVCYGLMLFYQLRTGRVGTGVPAAYWFATMAGALSGGLVVIHLMRRRLGLIRPKLRVRQLYAYAVPIGVNSVVAVAIVWTDLMCLGLFADPAQVGMYRACMQAAIAFDLIWNACSAATAPLYPTLVAEHAWTRLQSVYGTAIRVAALLTLPMLAVIVTNAGDILGLLHPEFRVAGSALVILALGHAVKTVFGAASVLLVLGRQQVREAGNGAISATLNLVLNLLLVPRFGLLGAASATATTLVTLSVLRCWQIRRCFRLASFDMSIFRAAVVTLLVAVAVSAGAALIGAGPGHGIGALAARVACMGCVLAPVFWFVCLGHEDRAALLGLLARAGVAAPVR